MSPDLPSKRRRLDDSTRVLHKPFVSPLRTRKADPAAQGTPSYQPSGLVHTTNLTSTASTPSRVSKFHAESTPVRNYGPVNPSTNPTDSAETAAQRACTAIELQIRSVRNEIDTLKQAARLSSSTVNSNLENLSQKWRLASQAAADELFEGVKARVDNMGGAAAWRDSEKQKYNRGKGAGGFDEDEDLGDEDCKFDSAGEELPEEEQEKRKREKRRFKEAAREAADADEIAAMSKKQRATLLQQTGGGDDDGADTFTMDMMLRSLNIELDIIGYDRLAERWIC